MLKRIANLRSRVHQANCVASAYACEACARVIEKWKPNWALMMRVSRESMMDVAGRVKLYQNSLLGPEMALIENYYAAQDPSILGPAILRAMSRGWPSKSA